MKKNDGSDSNPADFTEQTTNTSSTLENLQTRCSFKIGIYGWRKRCLYILILLLLVMVIVNLALTLWVLKVMEFSSEGMGQLKIVTGGIRLEGKAFVLDTLIASSIKSRTGQPIVVESSRNLTLSTRSRDGYLENILFLGNDRFECLANSFKVMDDRGMLIFSADDREVIVGSDTLRVTGKGGASFSGSVQTSLVKAQIGSDLRLESPTRSLEIHGPKSIHLQSKGGGIEILSLNDLKMKSEEGPIRLESSSVLLPMLPTAISTGRPSNRDQDIYQLCICKNGKLFLSPPQSICSSDADDLICR